MSTRNSRPKISIQYYNKSLLIPWAWIWNVILFYHFFLCELTFLNVSRLHGMDPKHFISTACCEFAITIGRARCILCGNRYHLNWPITYLILSNLLLPRSGSSHAMNKNINAPSSSKIGSINDIGSIAWCVYKMQKKNSNRIKKEASKLTKDSLNYFHVYDEHRATDCDEKARENHHEYGLNQSGKIMTVTIFKTQIQSNTKTVKHE